MFRSGEFFQDIPHELKGALMSEIEWLNIFGDNLLRTIIDSRMTQRELADAAGLSESVISDYVNKRKMPGIRAIVNISYVLGLDINEMIDFGEKIK